MNRRLAWSLVPAGIGLLLGVQAGWIEAKAGAAQWLMERAWRQGAADGAAVRPWPWADTWPVARLCAPEHGIDEFVLADDSGRSLAFGPGHAPASALPGEPGIVLISGHRDTHFAFLRDLRAGERIVLDTGRETFQYRIIETAVVDARTFRLAPDEDVHALLLVTCYPFDALRPGGPGRYLVRARQVAQSQALTARCMVGR